MNKRTEQIGSVIREAVQRVISRGLNDPRVRGIITVTDVRVTPDLNDAFLMVSILPEEHQELTMHGLKAAAGHIRRQIGGDVAARKLPRLNFRLDERMKKEAAVLGALAKVAHERDNKPPAINPEDPHAADDESGTPGAQSDTGVHPPRNDFTT